MPDQPKILKEYAPAQIERIMAILDRASDGRQIDSEAHSKTQVRQQPRATRVNALDRAAPFEAHAVLRPAIRVNGLPHQGRMVTAPPAQFSPLRSECRHPRCVA